MNLSFSGPLSCLESDKKIYSKVDSNNSRIPVANSMVASKIIIKNPNKRGKWIKRKKILNKPREGKKGE